MSYDYRKASQTPKRNWRQDNPKKWSFYDPSGPDGRLIKPKATDTEWIAEYSVNGTTYNRIDGKSDFADLEEGKLAIEAHIVAMLKKWLAKFD